MSATVGQEMVFHEAEKQPLWNDEDAMQQARSSPGPASGPVIQTGQDSGQPPATTGGSKKSEGLSL
jgi:hypothetical protein